MARTNGRGPWTTRRRGFSSSPTARGHADRRTGGRTASAAATRVERRNCALGVVRPAKAGAFSGVRPTEAGVSSLVAWIPGRKETEFLKRIDKAILGMVSE